MLTPPGPPSAPPMPAVLAPSLNGGSGRWTSPRRAVFSSKGVSTKIRIWLRFWGKMCIDYACCTQSFLYTPHAHCI